MNSQQVLEYNDRNMAEFRSTEGKLSSFGDAPVLLLMTVGAKRGRSRTSPMMYLAGPDPDLVYVFASAAGADTNPAWFTNLVAHAEDVGVEIGDEQLKARAEVLPETDPVRVFAVQAARYPGFAGYQEQTRRPIPVVALRLNRAT